MITVERIGLMITAEGQSEISKIYLSGPVDLMKKAMNKPKIPDGSFLSFLTLKTLLRFPFALGGCILL
jgi:hypothetical protein